MTRLSPASGQRASSWAISAIVRAFMMVTCTSGCGRPSGSDIQQPLAQLSPCTPPSGLSSHCGSATRPSVSGRITIAFKVPASRGEA